MGCRYVDRQSVTLRSTDVVEHNQTLLSQQVWYLLQRLLALIGCVLLLPVFAVLYAAVRGTSKGPFLFRQLRRGYQDRPFCIYKIRTLRSDPQRPTALWLSRRDPNITAIGRVLRDLKLDELPQLWNVALGQMQLVGPRPIPIELDDFLRRHVLDFAERNSVRPGLTSIAQLLTRECCDVEDVIEQWTRRFELDRECIRNKSIRYDLWVLGKTAAYLLRTLVGMLRHAASGGGGQSTSTGGPTATVVLGIRIANLDYGGFVNQIGVWVRQPSHHYVTFCSVHSMVEAIWSRQHRRALEQSSLNAADGVPVVWAQKLLGYRAATRVVGPALMVCVLQRAEAEGWRIALYGGTEGRLGRLVSNLRRRYPRLKIVDAVAPPFRVLSREEDDQMVARLNCARPDVIFVGLGCPKQERWMLEHSGRVGGVMLGVGAAFDFLSGAIPRAPRFLQRCGLEWAHRLCCEPRRLFWRYATTNPVYVALILRQVAARFVLGREYQVSLDLDPIPPIADAVCAVSDRAACSQKDTLSPREYSQETASSQSI